MVDLSSFISCPYVKPYRYPTYPSPDDPLAVCFALKSTTTNKHAGAFM